MKTLADPEPRGDSHMTSRVRVFVFLLFLSSGCGPRPPVAAMKSSDTVIVYEGLPHQFYEAKALEQEKKKPTVELGGFPFYREPLELNDSDRQTLKNLIGDPGSLKPFSGAKKCGGFHPDYAVEWVVGKDVYHYLICFGCWEAKVMGSRSEAMYDVAPNARERLKALLEPYRKNRPETGQAGP